MNIGRGRPREVYRVYDEDEFLAGDERTAAPTDPLGATDPTAAADPLAAELGVDFLTDSPDTKMRDAHFSADARRHRARPLVLLAAGVGVVVFAAIEMHASVGRVTRPLPLPRPGLPGTRGARRSRLTGRPDEADTQRSSRGPEQTRGPGAGHRRLRAGHRARRAAPGTVPRPVSARGDVAPPVSVRAATTSSEFGFEQ